MLAKWNSNVTNIESLLIKLVFKKCSWNDAGYNWAIKGQQAK